MRAKVGEIWDMHFPVFGKHPGLVFHAGDKDCWACLITESDHLEKHVSWMVLPGKPGGDEMTGLVKPSTLKPDKFERISSAQIIGYRGFVDPEVMLHATYWARKTQEEANKKGS